VNSYLSGACRCCLFFPFLPEGRDLIGNRAVWKDRNPQMTAEVNQYGRPAEGGNSTEYLLLSAELECMICT
jgi:hypothetical protein